MEEIVKLTATHFNLFFAILVGTVTLMSFVCIGLLMWLRSKGYYLSSFLWMDFVCCFIFGTAITITRCFRKAKGPEGPFIPADARNCT